ncbi:MAG: MBL fold metallo-hydrolase [Bacteroidales bacterium]|nr:MBL fold metallo-hydrolase [Bacteroidales bacterium]
MKISVLADNMAGPHTPAEHGLSYLLESEGKKILFDTGQSDLFLMNAASMNINLSGVDMIVLSHGHFDHGNGLNHLNGGNLLCHPGCFSKRYRKSDMSYIGLKNTKEELERKFNLTTSAKPYHIAENIIFLGEIPRLTSFESKSTSFVYEDGTPDFVMDDSAVAMILTDGLFVVTGCGHAGIVNTLEYAVKITGTEEIYGIMGGFHLKEDDLQTDETIKYLHGKNVTHVLPSHCTSGAALTRFYATFRAQQVKTGDKFQF